MEYEEDVKVNPAFPVKKKWVALAVIGIIILVVLFSTFYTVGPDEVVVIKRFGRYVRMTDPGLHVKIPFAETATPVRVKHVFKEEFGFRTLQAGIKTIYSPRSFDEESLMLTGDLNVGVVEWIIQYRINNPLEYLFQVKDVNSTVRDVSEVVMREVVGDHSVDEVLTVGRVEVTEVAQRKLQEILDSYQSGIRITAVKLKDVNPPDLVKPSFNEVNESRQEKEETINQAWQKYNEVIPRAKGEAVRTISQAEGYAIGLVNTAAGDANRFMALWEEYRKAKDVTKRRLYLETLRQILPQVGRKYIIDIEQKGILPLLSLDEEGGAK